MALKQHTAFEHARAEKRIAPVYVRSDGRVMDGHEADRFAKQRIRSWPTNQLMLEGTSVKGLMLRPDRHEEMIGIEVFRCEPTKS